MPTTGGDAEARRRLGPVAVLAGVSGLLGLVQVFCVWSGAVGLRLSQPLAIAAAVVFAGASCLFATRFTQPRDETARTDRPLVRGVPYGVTLALTLVFCGAMAWCVWVYAQLWLIALLRPPFDWDGLFYHIPPIHSWAAAGRVVWVKGLPDIPFANGYPMGAEVSTLFTHYVLRTSRLVNGVNLWYWPLGVCGIAVIAAKLGARGAWPWIGGSLLFGVSTYVSQSVSCYTDPAFASTVIGAIAASCVVVSHEGPFSWWSVVLWGINTGLMVGTKGTGAPFAVVIFGVVSIALLCRHGWRQGHRWLVRVFVGGLILLSVGGYWHMRNVVMAGNPIYPIRLKVGATVIFDGHDHVSMLAANLPPWLKRYPSQLRMFVSWLQLDAPISGYGWKVGGLGYLWIAGAVPAFVYLWIQCLWGGARRHRLVLGFLTVLGVALLTIQPVKWWARHTQWVHAVGLPCFVVVIQMAVDGWPRRKWRLVTVVLGMAVVGVAIWESCSVLSIEWLNGRDRRFREGLPRFRSTLQAMFPTMARDEYVWRCLHAKRLARGPWHAGGTLLGGILAMPLGRREIVALPASPNDAHMESLRKRGIQWIVWDTVGTDKPPDVVTRNAEEARAYKVFRSTKRIEAFHFIRLRAAEMPTGIGRGK